MCLYIIIMSLISLVSNQDKSNSSFSSTTSLDNTEMYSIQVSIFQFLPLYLADLNIFCITFLRNLSAVFVISPFFNFDNFVFIPSDREKN